MHTISFEKTTLPNGLDLILHEDHSIPIVAVNIWYHVGSKDEEAGKTGFAHLFEHMMFAGSKNHNSGFFEPLQKIGANLNGSTTTDRTNYWVNVPSNYLELLLWLESDRMGFLLDAMDQKKFDIQRDVVKNERRQSYENRPYGTAYLRMQTELFPAPHPYNWPTIGSQKDLDSAELSDVKDFFKKYYSPSNASIAIAGDFDPNSVSALVEKYFGDIEPGPALTRLGHMKSSLKGPVSVILPDRVQLPRLYLSWPTGAAFGDDEPRLTILSMLLGDGKSSRLYKKLVYDLQIASDVSVAEDAQEIAGDFTIQVTANPDCNLDEIEGILWNELEELAGNGPNEQELERAKNRIKSQHITHLEKLGGFGGRADQLNYYNVIGNNPNLINQDLIRYLGVSTKDVKTAASMLRENHVKLSVIPKETLTTIQPQINRSIMPSGTAPATFSPSIPWEERLHNGLRIIGLHRPGIQTVGIGLITNTGATSDHPKNPGVAHMMASMLSEGTSSKSSQQISESMEYLGSQLSIETSRESTAITTEILTEHFTTAMEIVSDVIQNPSFPQHELKRVLKERITDLKRIPDNPMAIASRASRALLYGPDSKYGHPLSGTESSIKNIQREILQQHFKNNFGPDNSTLIMVGDVEKSVASSIARKMFDNWHNPSTVDETSVQNSPYGISSEKETTIYLADKPGAAQSVILAGHVTIPRHHEDYFAFNLLNHIFGGQFTARLNMNLREDKGFSYGYMSSIDWLNIPSALLAGGSVQTEVTKESVLETIKEFSDIKGPRPITKHEFVDARDSILRSLPSHFETNGQILQQLARIPMFNLPIDYFSTFSSTIENLRQEDIHRVANTLIKEDSLTVLVVGDRSTIGSDINSIGLPVIHVDYEGRPA